MLEPALDSFLCNVTKTIDAPTLVGVGGTRTARAASLSLAWIEIRGEVGNPFNLIYPRLKLADIVVLMEPTLARGAVHR